MEGVGPETDWEDWFHGLARCLGELGEGSLRVLPGASRQLRPPYPRSVLRRADPGPCTRPVFRLPSKSASQQLLGRVPHLQAWEGRWVGFIFPHLGEKVS